MQFGYPYLIRLSFFKIQANPDPVLKCRIWLDRDPETGSYSTLLRSWYKQLLSQAIPRLEVQTVAFKSTRNAGSTNSRFINQPLRWRYIQLLSKATPALLIQTVAF